MKILDYLNVSNLSNLEADSGFIFQRQVIDEILRQKPTWEVYFIAPKNPLPEEPRLHHIPLEYGQNKYEVRFNFPWFLLKEKLSRFLQDIDLIYVNQSEQTANFRALVSTIQPDREIPIVSYIHYFPIDPPHIHFDNSPNEYNHASNGEIIKPKLRFDGTLNTHGLAKVILSRQIEALQLSKQGLTCSQYGIDLIRNSIQKIMSDFTAPIAAISPPVSLKEAEVGKNIPKSNDNSIVFNHRLYSHYGPKEFFDFLDWYHANRKKDFQVIITDPTHGRSGERNRLDTSVDVTREQILTRKYVTLKHAESREEYYATIGRCKLAVAPFKPSALWSMSVVDCMAAGTPVLAPNYACFPEILGGESRLLVKSREDLADKLDDLFENPANYTEAREYCIMRANQFSAENTARRFVQIFEKVCNPKK